MYQPPERPELVELEHSGDYTASGTCTAIIIAAPPKPRLLVVFLGSFPMVATNMTYMTKSDTSVRTCDESNSSVDVTAYARDH